MRTRTQTDQFRRSRLDVCSVVLIFAIMSLMSFNAWIMDQKGQLTIPRPRIPYSTVRIQGVLKYTWIQTKDELVDVSIEKGTSRLRKSEMNILEEFIMKRGNPPHQLESFCPRCPLNEACYTNSSEYDDSLNDIFQIKLKLLQQIIGIQTNALHSQNMILNISKVNLLVTMHPCFSWGIQG